MNNEDNNSPVKGRAKGGIARANALTPEQKKEIAQKAAAARWDTSTEIAVRSGVIEIGDIEIPCAVLKDGTRLLSERAVTKAFGGKRGGSHWKRIKENQDGANLPIFLSAKNIHPFINNDLANGLQRRRIYRAKKGAAESHGIDATLLPKICNALLSVRDAKKDHPSQSAIIVQADIIMRGLAEVGITALVDEATGYIHDKRKEEYRDLFREFIRNECRAWEKEVPDQFTDMLYRLYNQPRGINKNRHPQFFGGFMRKYIYTPLANSNGAVLEMLDEKNPVVYKNGGRRYKMHSFLTETVGISAFRQHLWQIIGIGNSSKSKEAFDRAFSRAFPKYGDQSKLPFDDEE